VNDRNEESKELERELKTRRQRVSVKERRRRMYSGTKKHIVDLL
jgi:hypothetical protein